MAGGNNSTSFGHPHLQAFHHLLPGADGAEASGDAMVVVRGSGRMMSEERRTAVYPGRDFASSEPSPKVKRGRPIGVV